MRYIKETYKDYICTYCIFFIMKHIIPMLCILCGFLTCNYVCSYSKTRGFIEMRAKKNKNNFFYEEETISQRLVPKTPSQVLYKNALENKNISLLFVNGPAGSGKTHMACDVAIDMLNKGVVDKIIVTRPTIPVDNEEIGFLPGTIQRKMAPWLIPVNDVFLNYYTQKEIDRMIFDKIIDFGPIAHMRGRTFTNAYIIADEMQNSTPLQMKMLLTRIGEDSKMIITGDLNQSDLKTGNNGFSDFITRYEKHVKKGTNIKDINLVWLTQEDVFRSNVVKSVIRVYDDIDDNKTQYSNDINVIQEIDQYCTDNKELDDQYLQIDDALDKLDKNESVVDVQNSKSKELNVKPMDSALIPNNQISKYFDGNDKLKNMKK